MREPYPLQWPEGWERTKWRKSPQFVGQFSRDRDSVIRQLKKRGASRVVITSDLPTRNDGLPYANATCSDPGIAVWWVERGKEQVMACDRWQKVAQNMRAIDMSLTAMRGLERWGSSQMVERAFAGFAALPPGQHERVTLDWRKVLGFQPGTFKNVRGPAVTAEINQRYRDRMRDAHPDHGGSDETAAELNIALAAATAEIEGCA